MFNPATFNSLVQALEDFDAIYLYYVGKYNTTEIDDILSIIERLEPEVFDKYFSAVDIAYAKEMARILKSEIDPNARNSASD